MQWVGALGAACGGGGMGHTPPPHDRERGIQLGAAGRARRRARRHAPRMKIKACPLRVALCCTSFRPFESFVSEG